MDYFPLVADDASEEAAEIRDRMGCDRPTLRTEGHWLDWRYVRCGECDRCRA